MRRLAFCCAVNDLWFLIFSQALKSKRITRALIFHSGCNWQCSVASFRSGQAHRDRMRPFISSQRAWLWDTTWTSTSPWRNTCRETGQCVGFYCAWRSCVHSEKKGINLFEMFINRNPTDNLWHYYWRLDLWHNIFMNISNKSLCCDNEINHFHQFKTQNFM